MRVDLFYGFLPSFFFLLFFFFFFFFFFFDFLCVRIRIFNNYTVLTHLTHNMLRCPFVCSIGSKSGRRVLPRGPTGDDKMEPTVDSTLPACTKNGTIRKRVGRSRSNSRQQRARAWGRWAAHFSARAIFFLLLSITYQNIDLITQNTNLFSTTQKKMPSEGESRRVRVIRCG